MDSQELGRAALIAHLFTQDAFDVRTFERPDSFVIDNVSLDHPPHQTIKFSIHSRRTTISGQSRYYIRCLH